jgi:glycosyltransferase involved in cell wall biosynthesis
MPAILREFPGAALRIVRGGDDYSRLLKISQKLELQRSVTFWCIISDAGLAQEYAACDVFALPSKKEEFGIV